MLFGYNLGHVSASDMLTGVAVFFGNADGLEVRFVSPDSVPQGIQDQVREAIQAYISRGATPIPSQSLTANHDLGQIMSGEFEISTSDTTIIPFPEVSTISCDTVSPTPESNNFDYQNDVASQTEGVSLILAANSQEQLGIVQRESDEATEQISQSLVDHIHIPTLFEEGLVHSLAVTPTPGIIVEAESGSLNQAAPPSEATHVPHHVTMLRTGARDSIQSAMDESSSDVTQLEPASASTAAPHGTEATSTMKRLVGQDAMSRGAIGNSFIMYPLILISVFASRLL